MKKYLKLKKKFQIWFEISNIFRQKIQKYLKINWNILKKIWKTKLNETRKFGFEISKLKSTSKKFKLVSVRNKYKKHTLFIIKVLLHHELRKCLILMVNIELLLQYELLYIYWIILHQLLVNIELLVQHELLHINKIKIYGWLRFFVLL